MSKSRSQSLLSRLVPAAATNERTRRRQQVLALVLFLGIGAACVGGVSMTERSAKRREAPAKIADLTLHPERPVKAVRLICTSDGNGTPMVVIMPPEIKPAL